MRGSAPRDFSTSARERVVSAIATGTFSVFPPESDPVPDDPEATGCEEMLLRRAWMPSCWGPGGIQAVC